MTVRELQSKLGVSELAEWIAYAQINPFGLDRFDLHAGIVAATIANAHSGKGGRFKPADFMPKFWTKPQTGMEMKMLFMEFSQRHNAKLKQNAKG